MFGKPYEGIHSYRLFDVAYLDVIVTIIGGLIISYFTKINVYLVLFLLFLFGIFVHRLFCVRTKIDRLLFD
jgi:uncharacterized membrane protein